MVSFAAPMVRRSRSAASSTAPRSPRPRCRRPTGRPSPPCGPRRAARPGRPALHHLAWSPRLRPQQDRVVRRSTPRSSNAQRSGRPSDATTCSDLASLHRIRSLLRRCRSARRPRPLAGAARGRAVADPRLAPSSHRLLSRAALRRARRRHDRRRALRHDLAVAVVQGGHLLAERYGGELEHWDRPHEPVGPDTPLPPGPWRNRSARNRRHVVGDGRLHLDGPAPVPEWADPEDPRHDITVDDLLAMRDGLASPGLRRRRAVGHDRGAFRCPARATSPGFRRRPVPRPIR